MLRQVEGPDDLTLLIRATPASGSEAIEDIAESALESAERYVIGGPGGERELLYGVSVFARRQGIDPDDVLRRFADAPTYLEAPVGVIRAAGFAVVATGANPDHFDVLLLAGRPEDESLAVMAELREAAARLVEACGDLRPNPAYAGGEPLPEEPR